MIDNLDAQTLYIIGQTQDANAGSQRCSCIR
jgi:hypothetical protein